MEHLEEFWGAVWDFFDLQADGDPAGPGPAVEMPGAHVVPWHPAQLRRARPAPRRPTGHVAVTAVNEDGTTATTTWAQLRAQVAALAALAARSRRPAR